jgi:hypothetical protein
MNLPTAYLHTTTKNIQHYYYPQWNPFPYNYQLRTTTSFIITLSLSLKRKRKLSKLSKLSLTLILSRKQKLSNHNKNYYYPYKNYSTTKSKSKTIKNIINYYHKITIINIFQIYFDINNLYLLSISYLLPYYYHYLLPIYNKILSLPKKKIFIMRCTYWTNHFYKCRARNPP